MVIRSLLVVMVRLPVAMAGGNTFRASKGHVQIQHAGETSFSEVPFSPDVAIYPGDLINIPERYF